MQQADDQCVGCREVEDVHVDAGPHELLAKDYTKHRDVSSHPEHEDDCIHTYEDRLHPGLVDVQLLGLGGVRGLESNWSIISCI